MFNYFLFVSNVKTTTVNEDTSVELGNNHFKLKGHLIKIK